VVPHDGHQQRPTSFRASRKSGFRESGGSWRPTVAACRAVASDEYVERVASSSRWSIQSPRQQLPREKLPMYWHGPQLGFQPLAHAQRRIRRTLRLVRQPGRHRGKSSHLLQPSSLPFEAYFKHSADCTPCNSSQRSTVPALAAGCRSRRRLRGLGDLRPQTKRPHVYHTIKRLLNYLRRPATSQERNSARDARQRLVTLPATSVPRPWPSIWKRG